MGVLEDAIREHLELKRQHGASEEEVVRQETEVLGQARQTAPAEGDSEVLPEDEAATVEQAQGQPAGAEAEPAAGEEPFREEEEQPLADQEAVAPEEPFGEEQPLAEQEPVPEEPPFAEAPPPAEAPSEGLYLDDEPAAQDTAESRPFDQPLDDEPSRDDTVMLDDPALPPEPEPEPGPRRDDTVMLEDPLEFDELEPGVAPPMPAQADPAADAPADGERDEDEDVLEETPEFLQETPEHDRLWFEQKPPRDFDFD
jgi:hypothetical protein